MDGQPEVDEDGRIRFQYQGVTFLAEATNETRFVSIIWPFSYRVSMHDIEEFSRVRKVLNVLNDISYCTLFYQEYKEMEEIGIHIRKHFLFTYDIPKINEYLRAIIGMLFRTQNELEIRVEKLKLREEETLQN